MIKVILVRSHTNVWSFLSNLSEISHLNCIELIMIWWWEGFHLHAFIFVCLFYWSMMGFWYLLSCDWFDIKPYYMWNILDIFFQDRSSNAMINCILVRSHTNVLSFPSNISEISHLNFIELIMMVRNCSHNCWYYVCLFHSFPQLYNHVGVNRIYFIVKCIYHEEFTFLFFLESV